MSWGYIERVLCVTVWWWCLCLAMWVRGECVPRSTYACGAAGVLSVGARGVYHALCFLRWLVVVEVVVVCARTLASHCNAGLSAEPADFGGSGSI